jgi:hypothetical protein
MSNPKAARMPASQGMMRMSPQIAKMTNAVTTMILHSNINI